MVKKTIKKKALTKVDILKGIVMVALFIAFLVYIESWWGLIALPFVFDVYFTRKINWSWWKELENPDSKMIMSWIDAIVFALVAVYFVNIYFFQNYTIPSSSLEKSLLVGDYLAVSKMSYGARVPQTPLHMPLCQHTLPFNAGKSYIEAVQWDYKRIHAKQVPLNDIVVFNYPAGDSILTDEAWQTRYYEMCYRQGWEMYGMKYAMEEGVAPASKVFRGGQLTRIDSLSTMEQRRLYQEVYELGRNLLANNTDQVGTIGWRPVDRRENYVKRCVGTPGQTLEIKDKIIYLDGKANKTPDNAQFNYYVWYKRDIPEELAHELMISKDDLYGTGNGDGLYGNPDRVGVLPLTKHAVEVLSSHKELVDSIKPVQYAADPLLYPQNMNHHWSQDNYGPLWIPAKGKQIPGGLTLENLPIYERLIKVYEDNQLEVTADGKILINGKEATNYTFKMDYYWMMGDNRHCSADSRYWGFVPEDHVVGKPTLIWMSIDPDRSLTNGGIRWNRLFRWVDNIK